ncbi:MAG: glycosyltransferase family 2 protein, partial [Planctomycetota bacterium]
MPTESPIVSIILATHNRKAIVQRTLESLRNHPDSTGFEIIVVDNHSEDGTADVAQRLADCLVALDRNEGSCAKSHGLRLATGQFVLFLDDDSLPRPGSISGMIAAFLDEPKLGAIGF